MIYEIWQLPPSSPYKYLHFDWIKKRPTLRDYVMVYSGEYDLKLGRKKRDVMLEDIFYRLNQEIPIDYHAAPMSVSDVVSLVGENNKRTWWYTDGIGFVQLDWEE